MSPSAGPVFVSTPAVSYVRAAEIVLYNVNKMQTSVWARSDAHARLSSRFAALNKMVNFPSVLLASVMTCGQFFSGSSRSFGIDVFLGVVGALVTSLVTFGTHFDFSGRADGHKSAAFALKRFERRLDHFTHKLRLRGTHDKAVDTSNVADDDGMGTVVGDNSRTTTPGGAQPVHAPATATEDAAYVVEVMEEIRRPELSGGESKESGLSLTDTLSRGQMPQRWRRSLEKSRHNTALEELLEVWDQLGSEYNSILESSPDLYGMFTGMIMFPGWMTCTWEKPLKVAGGVLEPPLSAAGKCYDFYYKKAEKFMEDRLQKETELGMNVDCFAPIIEKEHSHQTPFNRSLFNHVGKAPPEELRSRTAP